MSRWAEAFNYPWLAAPSRSDDEHHDARRRSRPLPGEPTSDTIPQDRRATHPIAGLSSAELLTAIKNGDRDAFSALYVATFERLWRFAAAVRGAPDIAQEVVQEIFLALWARRHVLDIHSDIEIYLFTAVRNRVRKVARHDDVVRAVESAASLDHAFLDVVPRSAPTPDRDAVSAEIRRAVGAALATVSERDRAALLLRWEEGRTYEEIGQILGISAMGAHKMVTRAGTIVRTLLDQYR
jgi:RNA polymerase sigma factor (sigma-70 family)